MEIGKLGAAVHHPEKRPAMRNKVPLSIGLTTLILLFLPG